MEDFHRIIDADFEEEVQFLQAFTGIESERAPSVTKKDGELLPFGEGVKKALDFALESAAAMGFGVFRDANYGGHVDFGNGPRTMGALCHVDVVPAGNGWQHAPYGAEIADGFLYGRGTTDNKGPAAAVLFAMRALQKAGFEPEARVRMVLGCDEETGWAGMWHYLEQAGTCDYGFVPDAVFPAVLGEKGVATFQLVRMLSGRKLTGLELTRLEGGDAANIVAGHARCVIHADNPKVYGRIREYVDGFRTLRREQSGLRPSITVKGVGKSLEIAVTGKSAHGAHPELGLNAVSVLMDLLGGINFASEEVNDLIAFYNDHIGYDLAGERLGCAFHDDRSGGLVLNVGQLAYDRKSLTLTLNVRYPVTCTEEELYAGIASVTDRYEFGIVKLSGFAPIWAGDDPELLETLLTCYRDYTGDRESQPVVISTGSYARAMPHFIAFGGMFPEEPDCMHQKDERISLDSLRKMTHIYAEAIRRLAGPDSARYGGREDV